MSKPAIQPEAQGKLKVGDVVNPDFNRAFKALANVAFDMPTRYKLVRALRRYSEVVDDAVNVEKSIFEQCGGVPDAENPRRWNFNGEHQDEVVKLLTQARAETVDLGVRGLQLPGNHALTAQEMFTLMETGIIEDPTADPA